MSYIIDEMINEKVEKIENEMEYLEKRKREELEKVTVEIKKKYSKKRDQLFDERRDLILHALYLDAHMTRNFIKILVNKIENKKYYIVNIPIKYNGRSTYGENSIYDYIVCGLTDDETKVEIKANEIYTEEDLNKEYEHFFRLYHYDSNIKEEDLKVNFLADKPIKYCNYANPYSHNDSCISGEENNYKFDYIRSYIENLVAYRLNSPDHEHPSFVVFKGFLNKFVTEYKQDEEAMKKSLRDPSFFLSLFLLFILILII